MIGNGMAQAIGMGYFGKGFRNLPSFLEIPQEAFLAGLGEGMEAGFGDLWNWWFQDKKLTWVPITEVGPIRPFGDQSNNAVPASFPQTDQ